MTQASLFRTRFCLGSHDEGSQFTCVGHTDMNVASHASAAANASLQRAYSSAVFSTLPVGQSGCGVDNHGCESVYIRPSTIAVEIIKKDT